MVAPTASNIAPLSGPVIYSWTEQFQFLIYFIVCCYMFIFVLGFLADALWTVITIILVLLLAVSVGINMSFFRCVFVIM